MKYTMEKLMKVIGAEWLFTYLGIAAMIFMGEVVDGDILDGVEELARVFFDLDNLFSIDMGLMLLGSLTFLWFAIGSFIEKHRKKKGEKIVQLREEKAA